MNIQKISSQLSEYNQEDVKIYLDYLNFILNEKKKAGQNWVDKNPWMKQRSDNQLASYFIAVSKDGLKFDGIDITLQSTGVSYSYQAFKNKMFLSYPESVIDVSIVYEGDKFSFWKESGHVHYSHNILDPFNQDPNNIAGAYCVIKNKRGEFLTLLSAQDIAKHRKVAKTDYIWQKWPKEMALKTIMKKACKQHFKDIYQNIETIDNENYDIDQPLEIEVEHKSEVENIDTIEKLAEFYKANKDTVENKEDFNKLVSARKAELEKDVD